MTTPTPPRSGNTVTGIESLDRKLDALESRIARKVVRSATAAGLTVLSKAIRDEITHDPGLSREAKRALKRAVGQRFQRRRRTSTLYEAKAGFGVGAARKKQPQRSGKNVTKAGRPIGTGLAGQNVHWFALGTQARYTKSRRFAGQIKPVRAVSRAIALRGSWAQDKMRIVGERKLAEEVAKLAKEK